MAETHQRDGLGPRLCLLVALVFLYVWRYILCTLYYYLIFACLYCTLWPRIIYFISIFCGQVGPLSTSHIYRLHFFSGFHYLFCDSFNFFVLLLLIIVFCCPIFVRVWVQDGVWWTFVVFCWCPVFSCFYVSSKSVLGYFISFASIFSS